MALYASFLFAMCILFVLSALVLSILSLVAFARRRGRRAAAYLALTLLAACVAAGFYFFRGLI